VGLIGKACFVGGLRDGVSLPQDEPAGFYQAQGTEVFTDGAAVAAAKNASKVDGMYADFPGHGLETDVRTESTMNELFGAPQPRGA